MNPVTRKEPLSGVKTAEVLLTARLTGGGAGLDMVNADSALAGGGEVVSATFVSTGLFDLVFRHSWVELKSQPNYGVGGTTVGLQGATVSIDVTAKTARMRLSVGNTVTDPATTDTVHLTWVVRDSGKNS